MTESARRATSDAPLRVRVAIPTYRRPDSLRELVPLVEEHATQVEQQWQGRVRVDVLVVDNDPGRSALDAGLESLTPRLVVVGEPRPGIAAARQRALEESRRTAVLAFIDDDERPCDGWLGALLDTWWRTGAAAVVGRVLAQFESPPADWILAGGFFDRAHHPTGSEAAVAAAGNLLLDLGQVRRLGVGFALDRGLRGGEDTLFTRQLTAAGGRIVWCSESAIVDVVPAARATRSWVLRRRYSHGLISTEVALAVAGSPVQRARVRATATAAGALLVAGGGLRAAYGRLSSSARHDARGMRTAARGAGRVVGALGGRYVEYGRGGDATAPRPSSS